MDKTLLQAFSDRAAQKHRDRTTAKAFPFPGMDTEILFQQLTQRAQLDFIGRVTENTSDFAALMDANMEMIYDCCPTLQDTELQKELGVVDPYDTVRKLLDIMEIQELAGQLMDWMGLKVKEDGEDDTPVKN